MSIILGHLITSEETQRIILTPLASVIVNNIEMSTLREICIENREHELICKQIDLDTKVDKLIEEICSNFEIKTASEYAFLYVNIESQHKTMVYLNDNNIKSIKFSKLLLDYEPYKMFQELKQNIIKGNKIAESFTTINDLLSDSTFSDMFFKERADKWLVEQFLIALNNGLKPIIIDSFVKLCDNYTVPNDSISDSFIEEIFYQLESVTDQIDYTAHIYTIIAYFIRNQYTELYEYALEQIRLPSLVQSVICDNELLHEGILDFINSVFASTPSKHQGKLSNIILEETELRICAHKYIMKKGKRNSLKLSHQLIGLQNMLNFNEKSAYNTSVTIEEESLQLFINLLQKYDPLREIKEVVQNIGFKSMAGIHEELLALPNMLVVDCFTFFITKNEGSAYYPEIGPSLLTLITVASIELVTCLQLTLDVSEQTADFPVLFEKPLGFKEFVCIIITSHRKMLLEYDITESAKVLSHFITRIRRSTSKRVHTFEQYRIRFEKIGKDNLDKTMGEQTQQWNENVKNIPCVKRLRDVHSAHVEQLLKKQTLNRMNEGIKAELVVGQKSKKLTKDEAVTFALNTSLTGFEYYVEGMQHNMIAIADINKVYFGESATTKIDEKLVKKVTISSLVVFETKNNDRIAFSIESEHHQLILDVIGFVANRKIDSSWEPYLYRELLDCFMDVSLMDLNANDIPSEAPAVPDLPQNFDFCCGK